MYEHKCANNNDKLINEHDISEIQHCDCYSGEHFENVKNWASLIEAFAGYNTETKREAYTISKLVHGRNNIAKKV